MDTLREYENAVLTVPIVEEELHVGRRTVETGRARITKRVVEREEIIDDPLMHEEVSIERVALNQMIDGNPPGVRYEGDTMIVPVFEEQYVVTKQLVLKEELHISRIRTVKHSPETVTLRSEEVTVERIEPTASANSAPAFDLP